MVNQFNENNKLIKESNKSPKSEREMAEMIKKNKDIQADCKKIEDDINKAKDFAGDVNQKLDSIDPELDAIRDKFNDKNKAIDEADELFDRAQNQLEKLDNVLDDQLQKINDVIAKLDVVNPINNPSTDATNAEFIEEVSQRLDKANEIRANLEKMKDKISGTRDDLIDVVQPLNELGDREVKQKDIDDCLERLANLDKDLDEQERDILPVG